jgi:hypothetical protein
MLAQLIQLSVPESMLHLDELIRRYFESMLLKVLVWFYVSGIAICCYSVCIFQARNALELLVGHLSSY